MLTLEELKELHDKAYQANQVTRERACDDMVFHWVTQWDDSILQESQLAYRGEFDILRKATRAIATDLENNPVQVDFVPKDDSREDGADLLDGLYRADAHRNSSIEAFENADNECIVCGTGAWQLYTTYESLRDGTTNQVIRRKAIPEANARVFWDPNDKSLDKSESDYCSVLTPYSEDAYKKLVKELTGDDLNNLCESSFKQPERSYAFPWLGGEGKKVWITEFYHRTLVKKNLIVMLDPFGSEMTLYEDDLEKYEETLIDNGYEIISEKKVEAYQVTKYIASGERILETSVIPGSHIPIVPEYGDHAVIEGEEHWEGVVRLAKDPQRLRNFQMSYLADISAQSPREKPIFTPDQINGFEHMYNLSGAENNYPYLLQNRIAKDGTPLPIGPIATLPAPQIPPALVASLELARQAVEDVANPGVPEEMPDREISGRAISLLQTRIDMQSAIYQKHRKHAHRRDGEIYASMAAEVYDVPRTIQVEKPDGTKEKVKTMQMVYNSEKEEFVVVNDLSNIEFEVYSRISASYASQKEQTLDRLDSIIQVTPPGDPIRNILVLKQLRLMDGVEFDDVREYANRQLLLMGIREPENEQEVALLQQQQEASKQPSPEMVLAMAEQLKGQAANKEADIKMMAAQADAASKNAKVQVDAFNAQTKRFEAQVDAQEAGADIDKTTSEALGKKIENQAKLIQLNKPENMTDDQLLEVVFGT